MIASRHTEVVWLVEDSPSQARLAQEQLSAQYDVEILATAGEALERLGLGALPDVLIIDRHLPDISGVELCREARARFDALSLPILMFTVHNAKAESVEALDAGANDYLTKPYDAAELRARVGSLAAIRRLRRTIDVHRERQDAERARLRALIAQAPAAISVLRGPDLVIELANARFRQMLSPRQLVGRPLREALPELAGQGFFELFERVMATGEPHTGVGVPARLDRSGDGGLEEAFFDYTFQPLFSGDRVDGILIHAVEVTEKVRTRQRVEKLAERLRESEDRLRLAAEGSGTGTWEVNLETQEIAWDARNKELFGLPPDARIEPDTMFEVTHPDDRDYLLAAWQRALEPGGTGEYASVFRVIDSDGRSERWLSSRGRVYATSGRPARMLGATVDVTAQKRTTRALELLAKVGAALAEATDSEAQAAATARLAVEGFADACVVDLLDGAGQVRLAAAAHRVPAQADAIHELRRRHPPNPAIHPIFAVLRSGRPQRLTDLDSPSSDALQLDDGHRQLLKAMGVRSQVFVPLTARGRVLGTLGFWRLRSRASFDEADLDLAEELARRAAVALDNIRLLRQAEAAQARMARLQAVTAGLSEARTPEQVAAVAITQGCAALGAPRGLLYLLSGKGDELVLVRMEGYPPEVAEQWRRIPMTVDIPLTEVARTGVTVICEATDEIEASYPNAKRTRRDEDEALGCAPLVLEGRVLGALGFAFGRAHRFSEEDRALMEAIARQSAQAFERARLYEAEAAARAEAERANRVKDAFLANVSHELRTPLNAILGWTRMLASRALPEEKRDRALETIDRNARTQARLIEDLLDFSRIIAGKLRIDVAPIEAAQVVEAAIETVRPTAEAKGVRLASALCDGPTTVLGDAERLQQIAWNLLANAIKFTPRDGQVTVTLRRDGGELELAVADTGRGIAADFLPQVFERFRQAESGAARAHGGLGLGLTIAKYLIEQHGGRIEARSEGLGRGAEFLVHLPLAAAALDARRARADSDRPTPDAPLPLHCPPEMTGLRVLLVEDEPDTRTLLVRVFESCQLSVTAASSVNEALEAFRQASFDVLVSDIGMPGETGYDLIRKIRRLAPEQGGRTPAVALTAYARAEDRVHALRAGFTSHVAKPVEPGELIAVIAALSMPMVRA